MKKNQKILTAVLGGAVCAAFTTYAVWDSLTHHGGRLVYPMNSYAFQSSDIPMLAALVLDAAYGVYLLVLLLRAVSAQKRQMLKTNRTRRVNPKWGFLGFLGFLGFAGFWSYGAAGDLTPFCFFVFFGFFGFFFEGKMSNTLMDERFKENAARAEQTAYRVGFAITFFLLILSAQSNKFSAKLTVAVLVSGLAIAVALTMFLSEYLLYRYDHDDSLEPEDE